MHPGDYAPVCLPMGLCDSLAEGLLQVAELATTNGPWAQGEGLQLAEQAGQTGVAGHRKG